MGLGSVGLALMVSVTAHLGADPNLYQEQTWEAPTAQEVIDCAGMAKSLNLAFDYTIAKGLNNNFQMKTATCEVFLLDEPADDQVEIKPASFKF